jgi:hypothetical protein
MPASARCPFASIGIPITLTTLLLAGCGSSSVPGDPPVITRQPSSQTVPLDSAATFAVVATGTATLHYQWSENGTPISGAIAAAYTSPPITLSDANDTFQVTITNSAGMIQSVIVNITIGARSPKTGDLRFLQVDAPSTINGWDALELTNFGANETDVFANALGAPMSVGPGCAGQDDTACYWLAQVNRLPSTVTGLSGSYGNGGEYADLDNGLAKLQDPQTVITGMDITKLSNAYGFSYTQDTTTTGLSFTTHTVPVAGLSAAIAAEGANGRVVTAISWNDSQVTFLSYAWTDDTSATYDTSVVTATYTNVDQVAELLAQQGYIITACGGDAYTPNLWMVGTKVTGDTMPRQILVFGANVSPQPIADGGYAIVGVFSQNGSPTWWVGER